MMSRNYGGQPREHRQRRGSGDFYNGRMYGYFRCTGCDACWESAHVYMESEGVYYEQECKRCGESVQPYEAEPIRCSICGQENCECDADVERHNDPNRPHRSDLCARCRAGLPC